MSIKSDLNKYHPRKEQQEALDFIIKTKKDKPDTKFFLLNLPVGLGKSHLSLMIADWYTSNIDKSSKIDIVTASKILQDQYDNEYESINNLKGKDNYDCSTYSCACGQGKEFNKLNKTSCESCPYDDAKNGFIGGKISLTNFYLYLIYAIYTNGNGVIESRKSNVLIVDEAHEFDEVMSDFISIKITETIIKRMKFSNEYEILSRLTKISNISGYIEFLNFLYEEILQGIDSLELSMGLNRDVKSDKRDLKISKVTGQGNSDVKVMQIISDLRQYLLKIDVFLKEYKNNPHNWVLETNFNEKTNSKELSLEPIWAYDYLDKYVWSRYDMVILMSGTILDKDLFSDLNGIDVDKTIYYSIESPFPVKNRPIYYMPLGKMSYNKKEETFKNYVPYIAKILNKYQKHKGIIHTNSFELSNWIQNSVKDNRLLFHDSSNKDEKLKNHFESEDPTVFVSPSVGTGVSFDYERSRFQVIAKIPYPSLGSQKNKLRQKNNPKWYSWKTVCGIIQMSGRSVRSVNDYADTIIIDGSFSDILRYSSDLMPNWFQEAIKKINVKIEA
jgi:ATP-dependent DNA helicase DinG